MVLLLYTASLPGEWALVLVRHSASLPGGSGHWKSFLGEVGSRTPSILCLTAWGVWRGMAWRGAVWCGVVWCGVVWCGVVWCGVVWCGVVWCGVVWCGVVWCGVVWCGVVWCGVVWCGVVWCGVPKALLPNGNGWMSCTQESAKREGCVHEHTLCVVCCALAATRFSEALCQLLPQFTGAGLLSGTLATATASVLHFPLLGLPHGHRACCRCTPGPPAEVPWSSQALQAIPWARKQTACGR